MLPIISVFTSQQTIKPVESCPLSKNNSLVTDETMTLCELKRYWTCSDLCFYSVKNEKFIAADNK